MVRLPGYADFLEQFDPGIRQRHADFGAPPGFSECIAWILPLRGEDANPHWSVTFAVDDTDAVAARARELGAIVLVMEPFDIPPVRSAVIRDPAGCGIHRKQLQSRLNDSAAACRLPAANAEGPIPRRIGPLGQSGPTPHCRMSTVTDAGADRLPAPSTANTSMVFSTPASAYRIACVWPQQIPWSKRPFRYTS